LEITLIPGLNILPSMMKCNKMLVIIHAITNIETYPDKNKKNEEQPCLKA
jgi:hypothetical protein